MFYGLRGISHDRKTAICKAVVDEANVRGVEDLERLGYEFVSKEEFDSVRIATSVVGSEPTQLDIIEAQVTYTAMMTDTLLEV